MRTDPIRMNSKIWYWYGIAVEMLMMVVDKKETLVPNLTIHANTTLFEWTVRSGTSILWAHPPEDILSHLPDSEGLKNKIKKYLN